jgi:hypothetical protein
MKLVDENIASLLIGREAQIILHLQLLKKGG